jgi:RNA polymerase sigma factor (sigma-70 family)
MDQQPKQRQHKPRACPRPLRDRCSTCPFSTMRLRQLRDADYWHCVECHYRDCRFNELIDAESIRAIRICISYGRLSDEDAEDVSQNYSQKLVANRQLWDGRSPKPWFNTILFHEIVDCQRQNRKDRLIAVEFYLSGDEDSEGIPEPTATGTEVSDPLILEETRCQIEAALNSIKNPTLRAIVALSIEGFESIEIQQMLSVNQQAVWNAKNRGFRKIREQLGLIQIE